MPGDNQQGGNPPQQQGGQQNNQLRDDIELTMRNALGDYFRNLGAIPQQYVGGYQQQFNQHQPYQQPYQQPYHGYMPGDRSQFGNENYRVAMVRHRKDQLKEVRADLDKASDIIKVADRADYSPSLVSDVKSNSKIISKTLLFKKKKLYENIREINLLSDSVLKADNGKFLLILNEVERKITEINNRRQNGDTSITIKENLDISKSLKKLESSLNNSFKGSYFKYKDKQLASNEYMDDEFQESTKGKKVFLDKINSFNEVVFNSVNDLIDKSKKRSEVSNFTSTAKGVIYTYKKKNNILSYKFKKLFRDKGVKKLKGQIKEFDRNQNRNKDTMGKENIEILDSVKKKNNKHIEKKLAKGVDETITQLLETNVVDKSKISIKSIKFTNFQIKNLYKEFNSKSFNSSKSSFKVILGFSNFLKGFKDRKLNCNQLLNSLKGDKIDYDVRNLIKDYYDIVSDVEATNDELKQESDIESLESIIGQISANQKTLISKSKKLDSYKHAFEVMENSIANIGSIQDNSELLSFFDVKFTNHVSKLRQIEKEVKDATSMRLSLFSSFCKQLNGILAKITVISNSNNNQNTADFQFKSDLPSDFEKKLNNLISEVCPGFVDYKTFIKSLNIFQLKVPRSNWKQNGSGFFTGNSGQGIDIHLYSISQSIFKFFDSSKSQIENINNCNNGISNNINDIRANNTNNLNRPAASMYI